ncbi:hypothetical protein N9A04_00010 [Rickettsiales bacterium]|nr:hypothetical protein [Rickettsiales bacterium]
MFKKIFKDKEWLKYAEHANIIKSLLLYTCLLLFGYILQDALNDYYDRLSLLYPCLQPFTVGNFIYTYLTLHLTINITSLFTKRLSNISKYFDILFLIFFILFCVIYHYHDILMTSLNGSLFMKDKILCIYNKHNHIGRKFLEYYYELSLKNADSHVSYIHQYRYLSHAILSYNTVLASIKYFLIFLIAKCTLGVAIYYYDQKIKTIKHTADAKTTITKQSTKEGS